jgi:hypothetical protein
MGCQASMQKLVTVLLDNITLLPPLTLKLPSGSTVCVCVCVCVCVRACACVCVCVCARAHACMLLLLAKFTQQSNIYKCYALIYMPRYFFYVTCFRHIWSILRLLFMQLLYASVVIKCI